VDEGKAFVARVGEFADAMRSVFTNSQFTTIG
jgi:hypothetical protein